jgi:hypothetical protein
MSNPPQFGRPDGSVSVTLLAVATFVLAALELVGYSFLFLVFGLLTWIAATGPTITMHEGTKEPEAAALGFTILAFLGPLILSGGIGIGAGVGLLRRRSWARWLTLGLGVLSGLVAVLFPLALFIWEPPRRVPSPDDPAINPLLVMGAFAFVVHGGYAAFAFVTLARATVAAEFGKRRGYG